MAFTAIVSMPKTSVNENDRFPLSQHDIGPPREVLSAETEPIAHFVKGSSNTNLRLGVF